MGKKNINKYCVIEVLDPPYSDFDKHVCVPSSWVRFQEALTEDSAVAKFPIENLSDLYKRVRKGEDLAEDWPSFVVHINYSTDSYQRAKEFIKSCKKEIYKRSFATTDRDEDPKSSIPRKKIKSDMNKSAASVSFINDARLADNRTDSEQEQLADPNRTACDKQIKSNETADSANTKIYFTRQARKTSESFKVLTSAASEKPLNQDNVSQEGVLNDCREEIVNYNANESNELIVEPTPILMDEPICLKAIADSLKKVHSKFLEYYATVDEIRSSFHENCTLLAQIIDKLNSTSESGPPAKTVLTNEDMKENQNETFQMETVNESVTDTYNGDEQVDIIKETIDGNENNVKGSNKNKSSSKKSVCQTRKFILPKEYDKNDSRWTLKHRKINKGLVELPPNSNVYVDALKLNNCKRKSKERKTLARMLFVEIFSANALSTCSFTGKRANAFDSDGTNIRPGLDQNAVSVLLNFVEEFGNEKKWPKINDQLICNSLRSKLQEMRSKALKKIKD